MEKWLTRPWQGLHKTYYDTMLDIIITIPGMLESYDTLTAATPASDTLEQVSNLRIECQDIAAALDAWQDTLSTACPSFTTSEANILRTQIDSLPLEDLPDVLIRYGPWYLFTWCMNWAVRIPVYCTALQIYHRFPHTQAEPILTPPVSRGTYCLAIARSVKYFLQLDQVGMLMEMAMRIPVSFVQKVLADPQLRSSGGRKMVEAEEILQNVGRVKSVLAFRGVTEDLQDQSFMTDPGVSGILQ